MKKGKGLTINLHFTNRWLYTFIAIGILAAVGVGVYAATYTASGAGHPYTEISTCPTNQILKMNAAGTAWTCGTDAIGITTESDPTVKSWAKTDLPIVPGNITTYGKISILRSLRYFCYSPTFSGHIGTRCECDKYIQSSDCCTSSNYYYTNNDIGSVCYDWYDATGGSSNPRSVRLDREMGPWVIATYP